MTYGLIASYLKAYKIIIRDIKYHELKPEEAKRRIVKEIRPGKVRPDELYVTVY